MNAPRTGDVALQVDGRAVRVKAGSSVAVALRVASASPMGAARVSVTGQPRAPFCGMGVCQECRVAIDGRRRLACQTVCRDGMRVETLR